MRKRYMFLTIILLAATFSVMAHYDDIYFRTVTYHDNNADGMVDSIVFVYSGTITEGDSADLRSSIVLPDWRNFTINNIIVPSVGTVVFLVSEWRDIPVTFVTSDDLFIFKRVHLTSGGSIVKDTILASDGVAPVLLSAQLTFIDSVYDSLKVTFSERVMVFNNSSPFIFKTPQNVTYYVNLLSPNLIDSVITAVPNTEATMRVGDSVYIDISASITDLIGNVQNNPENRRVLLEVSEIKDEINFTEAFYYDSNADGFIDSIRITTVDTIEEKDLAVIRNLISLPASRNFSIESIRVIQNSIVLIVNENREEPQTGINDSDVIIISQGLIYGKTLVRAKAIEVQDKVAPVILWAHLDIHDVGSDTIKIRFSEQVSQINNSEPFLFLRPGQNQYQVILQRVFQGTDRFTGNVISLADIDSIRIGDSVWINTVSQITDLLGNVQQNPDNRRVALTIDLFDFPIVFNYAAYFDNNSDGLIDVIKLYYSGPLLDEDLTELTKLIKLPSIRHLLVQSVTKIDSVVIIYVKELSRTPRTNILSGDRIVIESGRLPEGGVTLRATITVLDSVPPVVISAHFDNYNMDQRILRITFSEPVKTFFNNQPFLFIKPDADQYNVIMMIGNSRISGSSYTGRILNEGHQRGIEENDSCWINNRASITDLNNNTQLSYLNRKVKITCKHYFNIRYLAENSPFVKGKRPIPQPVENAYSVNNVQMPSDGLVLIVEPDRDLSKEQRMQGTVSIYDVVQNVIIQKKIMVYDNDNNRLYYVWDGRNYNGREVGTGTYLAVIKVITQEKTHSGKINVGVKR